MSALERLRSPDAAECLAAIAGIAAHRQADRDEVQALAECLGSARKVVQRRAAEAFAALNDSGVPVQTTLVATLQSSSVRQRWGAAYALSLLGAPPAEAVPVLLETLGSDDGDMRWAAADILVRMHGARGPLDQLQALLRADNPLQRKMAAYCLRDLGTCSPAIEHALLETLDDADTGVQLAAMSSLARLTRDRQTVAQRLVAFLESDNARLRRAAAATLGVLGERSEPVLAALRAAADDPDASLQRAAARALRLLAS